MVFLIKRDPDRTANTNEDSRDMSQITHIQKSTLPVRKYHWSTV